MNHLLRLDVISVEGEIRLGQHHGDLYPFCTIEAEVLANDFGTIEAVALGLMKKKMGITEEVLDFLSPGAHHPEEISLGVDGYAAFSRDLETFNVNLDFLLSRLPWPPAIIIAIIEAFGHLCGVGRPFNEDLSQFETA